ncbi:MAG: hypothetical protein JST92_16165 [Deltaproteobacteria bacterium]|nr:hypothetical protein [Deltaproteobacteria bacterium]
MPDDKPKRTKSWSEIDKGRDKGGSRKRDDRERESFQKTTGYTKYKTNLDRLFSGGVALPDELREKLGESDEEAQTVEARKKLFAIEDTKEFNAAATEFLKKNSLPDDARLLDRLLSHPDEDIVEQALGRLEALHKAGALKAPPALKARLSSVEIDSGIPSVRRRAAELRKALPG